MYRLETFRLLVFVCFLERQLFSVPAFLIQPRSLVSTRSSLLARPEEEEWLQKKNEREEAQKEWERKIQARDERKANGKSGASAKGAPPARWKANGTEAKEQKNDDDDETTMPRVARTLFRKMP
jgi:hypothetical protein